MRKIALAATTILAFLVASPAWSAEVPVAHHRAMISSTRQGNAATPQTSKDLVVPVSLARAIDPQLQAKIGQMIMIGFEGAGVEDPSFQYLLEKVRAGHISGVLYLQRNLARKSSIIEMNAAMQAASAVPVLTAVDQEGGAIQRIPKGLGFPRTPSARETAGKLTPRQAYETYSALAGTLAAWGFNLNLGPVVDVNINPSNPIIGKLGRSFSADPKTVVQYASAFVTAHRDNGVLTALKHFPGHGSATSDSHLGFADVTKTSKPSELDVFRQLVAQGDADLVMSGHTYDGKLQPDARLPASLDPVMITTTLRKKLKFSGAVITDDLEMSAVAANFKLKDAVVRAVLAGNNIIVFGNSKTVDPDIDVKVTKILVEASQDDPRVLKAIERSYAVVMAMKRRLPPQNKGLDQIHTRSIAPTSGSLVTPDFIRLQARDFALVLPDAR